MKRTIMIWLGAISIMMIGFTVAQPSFVCADEKPLPPFPVILDSETLFRIHHGIGVLSAEKRAGEITAKLQKLLQDDRLNYDDMIVVRKDDYLLIVLGDETVMAVTKSDAAAMQSSETALAEQRRNILVAKLKTARAAYSKQILINDALYTLAFLSGLFVFFWLLHKIFPWIYKKIEGVAFLKGKGIKFKDKEISPPPFGMIIITLLKGLRFVLSLVALYACSTSILKLWPYTKTWNLQPVIQSIVLLIFYTVLFLAVSKGINILTRYLIDQYHFWKGTKFKPLKIQSVELLSAERFVELANFVTRASRLALIVLLSYTYATVSFGLFDFSKTWSQTLANYLLSPLQAVLSSFLKYLPNLFYITVLSFVFYYIIKLVRFFFIEIDKGNIRVPGFYRDWAMSTFKIVRFLILALGLIIIFPYLPGSDSPFFKGISVFLGILFSLGSTSAIANIVAGVVLTYMRPFKIGDRVQIADTVGDVIEKTLLVSRIRTVKNVDVTIPNALILSSHIINYSSATTEKGLILHTSVTIGYDAPWLKVHELLTAAARETQDILPEPAPFVLQKSLDDFYVSYELNAYTREPGKMSAIYSDMHAKIQDKFNEAGIEIMSPHYGAIRDGNQTALPREYLPKDYRPPSFRLFGVDLFGGRSPKDR